MSEILAEDSSRRPPGHVRRLPRQLSFFGFQGDDNQDSINRVRSNRCRVPAGLRSDSSHHSVCGRPKRRSQRVAQDFAANTVGRIKKEYQERDWVVLRNLSSGLLLRDLVEKEKLQFVRHTCRSPK